MREIVICIGAGYSQLPYIRELNKRGYNVFCVDQNEKAPGFELADDHVISSTFDYKNTLGLIAKRLGKSSNVVAAIAPCTGPPYRTLQEVRKQYGLSFTESESIDILLDKKKLRKKLNDLGCSNIPIYEPDKLNNKFHPIVRKPRFGGMGGRGVQIIKNLKKYNKLSSINDIDEKYVNEYYIEGRELAIDAIWDGKSIRFMNLGWTLFDNKLNEIIGSTSQSTKSIDDHQTFLIKCLEKFCLDLSLQPEILNVDAIIDKDNNIHIIEVEFVPSDGIFLCQETFNYNIISNFINCHLGKSIDPQTKRLNNALMFADIYDNLSELVPNHIHKKKIETNSFSIGTEKINVNKFWGYSTKGLAELLEFINRNYPSIAFERPFS